MIVGIIFYLRSHNESSKNTFRLLTCGICHQTVLSYLICYYVHLYSIVNYYLLTLIYVICYAICSLLLMHDSGVLNQTIYTVGNNLVIIDNCKTIRFVLMCRFYVLTRFK